MPDFVINGRFVVPKCLLMLQQHTYSLLKLILISVYFYTGPLPQTQNTVTVLCASDCWRRITRERFQLSCPACYTCRYNMITWFTAAECHSVSRGNNSYPEVEAVCTVGTGCPFPAGKARPELDADHSTHLMPRSVTSRSYTYSPPCSAWTRGQLYFIYWYLSSNL
jgi:hypothetical protein